MFTHRRSRPRSTQRRPQCFRWYFLLMEPEHFLLDRREPFCPVAKCIDLLAGMGNPPTPIDRFYACHHSGEIPRDRQVRACQFSQSTKAVLAVVHGSTSFRYNSRASPRASSRSFRFRFFPKPVLRVSQTTTRVTCGFSRSCSHRSFAHLASESCSRLPP